jgi:hypothetical protein
MFLMMLVISMVMATSKPATTSSSDVPAAPVETPAAKPMPQGKVYGASDFAAPTLKLNQVLKEFDTYKNQPVTIEGKVAQVCEEKGCWIKIEDQNVTVRAIMKGHAFSVTSECCSSLHERRRPSCG